MAGIGSHLIGSNASPDELLAFNNNELMMICESQACINARNLISAIERIAEHCCGFNVPVSPETMSTIFDHYITQFSRCFKDEYNLKTSFRPRVLRSVSENEEVFETSSFNSRLTRDSEALENIEEGCSHKFQGNGVTYTDNESKFSKMFPNIPKTARRRMSADDVALPSSLSGIQTDNQKVQKNKRSVKRGMSFHGSAQQTKHDGSGEGSSKGIVHAVFSRFRRASYSRQGKV